VQGALYGRDGMTLAEPSASYRRLVLAIETAVDDVPRLRILAREVRVCDDLSDDERDDLLTRAGWYEHGCKPAPAAPYLAT
jgi:hypothetical protein